MSKSKAYPFPILSPSDMYYKDSIEYKAKIRLTGRDSILLEHSLSGDSFVSEQLKEGRANFACVVTLTDTLYRHVFAARDCRQKEFTQEIDFSECNSNGRYSPWFKPIIVSFEDIRGTVDDSYGMHEIWLDRTIEMPEGSILAFTHWYRIGGTMDSILVFEPSPDLQYGELQVTPDTSDGFRFRVQVEKGFLDTLRRRSSKDPRIRNISVYALSAGFRILREEFKDTGWKEHKNLEILASQLDKRNMLLWDDEDFSPEKAATMMYPLILTDFDEKHEDDD